MKENDRKSILEYIANSSGYDIALMTTFNFEIPYFERAVLYQLTAHNVKTISLYVDASELNKSVREVDSCHIGRRYMVNPVRLNGSFHPKVVLLLGEKKAKLIVASANITTSGYAINNEVYSCITYSVKEPQYLDVICDAINFFVELDKLSPQLDSETIKEITAYPYYRRAPKNGDISLVHNLNAPILDQVTEKITEKINAINVAVPYYDPSLAALSTLKKAFPDAGSHLFIQNSRSTFPKEYNDENGVTENIDIFGRFLDNESGSFYHGKVFLFKGEEHDYILYGSANCTMAALALTHASNGNIECCFLTKGESGEFDSFFDNLELCSEEPLTVRRLDFEPKETKTHFFKYCKVIDDVVYLHFNYKEGIAPAVKINDINVEYNREWSDLVITVPDIVKKEIGELFYAIFEFDGTREWVKCWAYHPEAIRNFRIRSTKDRTGLDTFDINSKGDKYLQDRINIINADNEYYKEIAEHNKQMAYANQAQRETDDDLSEDEDYIIDVDIPEDYSFSYRKHQKVEEIRATYINRLYRRYSFLSKKPDTDKGQEKPADKPVEKPEPPEEAVPVKKRTPSSDEKRFYRFLKSRIKGITNPKDEEKREEIEKIEPMPMLSRVQIYIEPFSKYRFVDLFDSAFVVESRVDLLKILLTKDFSNVEKENIEYIVLLECYQALAENYFLIISEKELNSRVALNYKNKELLDEMDKKYHIRDAYKQHISDLLKSEDPALKEAYREAFSKYVEDLFGYKTLEMLEDYAKTRFDDASISVNNNRMVIQAKVRKARKYFTLDYDLLREIRNFSKRIERVDFVTITGYCRFLND